jgi:uncharacterized protein
MMRNLCKTALTVLLLLTLPIQAERSIPPRNGRTVVDTAELLSPDGEARIEQEIAAFGQATKAQLAVLTIPSLKGDILEAYALRVAESWKIGHTEREDGLLILLSKKERRIRFEVGNGLEGVLNDARCGDIIRGMTPYLEGGNFELGILYAIGSCESYITGRPPARRPSATASTRRTQRNLPPVAFFILLVLILVSRSYFFIGPVIYSSGRGHRHGGFGGGFGGGGGFSGGSFGGGGFSGGGASGSW